MPFNRRLGRLLRSIPLLIPLAVGGCAGTLHTPLILAALDCASVIPNSYRTPVAATAMPGQTADAGDLWGALDDQTSRLDRANGRTSDVISMADSCQVHQAKVLATLTPHRPWWRWW